MVCCRGLLLLFLLLENLGDFAGGRYRLLGTTFDDGKVRPLDVKVGDRILFGKYSGQAVKVEGTEYLVMREDDIMGVVAK